MHSRYTIGVQKICTPFAFYPGEQACTHFHLTPSMYTLCTPKKDECIKGLGLLKKCNYSNAIPASNSQSEMGGKASASDERRAACAVASMAEWEG